MSIAHEGSNTDSANNDDLVITTHANAEAGDILIASLIDDQSGNAFTDSGSLFTELFNIEQSSSRLTVLYYVLPGSPAANYTFQTASTGAVAGILAVFSKTTGTWAFVDQSGNDYTSNGISGDDDISMSSTDSTTDGMLVTCWGSDELATISIEPGGQTQSNFINVSSCATSVYYESTTDTNITDTLRWNTPGDYTNISFALVESGGAPTPILPIISYYNMNMRA